MNSDIGAVIDNYVRSIADWPEPGVTFRDITPLLADPDGLSTTIAALTAAAQTLNLEAKEGAGGPIDAVIGIEARGFIFAPAVAVALHTGFVPVRKAGKLPADVRRVDYELEYGTAAIEMHTDAISPGDRVIIIDDVLATGGTMAAVSQLVADSGATVVANLVLIELLALEGRGKLDERTPLVALRSY